MPPTTTTLRFLAHLFAAIEASGVELGREFRYLHALRPRLAPGTCADLLTSALDWRRVRADDLRR